MIRVVRTPDAAQLAELNSHFAEMTIDGSGLSVSGPLPVEVSDDDELDHARLVLRLNPMRNARLHELIDALNDLGTSTGRPDVAEGRQSASRVVSRCAALSTAERARDRTFSAGGRPSAPAATASRSIVKIRSPICSEIDSSWMRRSSCSVVIRSWCHPGETRSTDLVLLLTGR